MQSNCKAVQQGRDHLLSRKLDKGSSNKTLCVYGCAAGEKSCLRLLKKKKKKFIYLFIYLFNFC